MSKKLFLTFALGAAAGAAIGYLLSSDENKEKIRNAAKKIKDTLKDEFEKGKEFMDDLKKGIWTELPARKPIDNYRRNLQKSYVEALITIINMPAAQSGLPTSGFAAMMNANTRNTDVTSVARAELVALKTQVDGAIPGTADKMSKYHLQDVLFRLTKALDPK